MDNIMLEVELMKIKIKKYEKEYLKKKGIFDPDPKTIILMRKSVSSRLRKEIKELTYLHNKIINKIYEEPSHSEQVMHSWYL